MRIAILVVLGVTVASTVATVGCGKLRERQAIRKYAEGAARANGHLAKLRALEAKILVVRKTGRVQRGRSRPALVSVSRVVSMRWP